MRSPLRSLAVFSLVFFTAGLAVGRCFPAHSGNPAPPPAPLVGSNAAAGSVAAPKVAADVSHTPAPAPPPSDAETIVIPGPLRSFLRMAGISQQVPNEDVLPMLARNVALWGHESGRETEFLVLLARYVE
jgi:hypothetical protein